MEEFKENDRVIWHRIMGQRKRKDLMPGEFQRLVKHKKNYTGKKKALVILDDRFYPMQVPVEELTREKRIK
jgi:hypothetical protein